MLTMSITMGSFQVRPIAEYKAAAGTRGSATAIPPEARNRAENKPPIVPSRAMKKKSAGSFIRVTTDVSKASGERPPPGSRVERIGAIQTAAQHRAEQRGGGSP